MQLLQKVVSNTLCCFGLHHEDDLERPATLRNLPNNVSNISMTIPTASIPNAASTSEELRKIFASDATPGGYNAAARGPPKRLFPQGSLDFSFQFGTPENPRKPAGRVELITNHVRQKLSQGRLSKESTRDTRTNAEHVNTVSKIGPAADESTELLGASQRSTGLTELLTSRAGSEGGYDSDARSIQTTILRSNAGTLRVSPACPRKSLKTIKSEDNDQPPRAVVEAEDKETTTSTPSSRRVVSRSSPLPITPTKTTFTDAMQIAPNESPSDALRRLSIGIANGTIQPPQTPELRALRLPRASEVENEWRVPMSAPQRASSLSKCTITTDTTIKRLSDRIATAKRKSLNSSSSENQRDSLISELNPALLECIDRYAAERPVEQPLSSPTTAIKIRDLEIVGGTYAGSDHRPSVTQSITTSTHDVSSTSTSAEQSLHLFNMRISQRLASNSRAPVLSTENSENTSSQSLTTSPDGIAGRSRTSSIARYPTFVTAEDTRRPSDLITKDLFEKLSRTQDQMTKKVSATNGKHRLTVVNHDDASSVYGPEFGGQPSTSGFSPSTSRRSSIKNPNSLAIGGRSVSEVQSRRRTGTGTIGYLPSSVEDVQSRQHTLNGSWETEDSWDTANASLANVRSFSLPTKHILPVSDVPSSSGRQVDEATSDNGQTNVEFLPRTRNKRDELMSEISVEAVHDRRNENFSEAEPALLEVENSKGNNFRQASNEQYTQSQPSKLERSSYGPGIDRTPARELATTNNPRVSIESPSTRLVKCRAARKQAQKLLNSEFLEPPQLDQKRSHRVSVRSISDTGPPSVVFEDIPPKRSQSMDGERPVISMPTAKEKLHRKSLPLLDLLSSGPVSTKAQTWIDRGKMKKKSIWDIGRRFTTTGIPTEDRRSSDPTKIKNALGNWATFPSHSRAQRNESAVETNGVRARDFKEGDCVVEVSSTLINRSTASPGLHAQLSQRLLSMAESKLSRSKTKSLNFNLGMEERAKRNRKGFVGRFRRLYRSSSSDFKAFANTHGHRSSISCGRGLEYPELEYFPSEALFAVSQHNHSTDVDGTADRPTDTASAPTSPSDYSNPAIVNTGSPDWVHLYGACVGSLSALGSSSDVPQKGLLDLGSSIRDSTENFATELNQQAAEAKARLLRQIQKSSSSASQRPYHVEQRLSIEMKIPGAFE